MKKSATKAEKQHLARLSAFGCIACYKLGMPGTFPEIHHIRETAGMGQRSSHMYAIPLCAHHHRGISHPQVPSIHLDRLRFIEQFGTEFELLEEMRKHLGDKHD